MNKFFYIYFLSLVFTFNNCNAQNSIATNEVNWVEDKHFDKKIKQYLNLDIPIISVTELQNNIVDYTILDAREKEEYDVSHIPNAQYIGYNQLENEVLTDIPKDGKVVLYCSIGYRSEKIGEKLRKKGFTNVHNLYGSIFEWVNQDYEVVDKNGQITQKVHTYNRNWSKWVEESKAEKIW